MKNIHNFITIKFPIKKYIKKSINFKISFYKKNKNKKAPSKFNPKLPTNPKANLHKIYSANTF